MQILDYVADILYRCSDGFCQEKARFVILRHIKTLDFDHFRSMQLNDIGIRATSHAI